jgi:large conductance mechanosensitive channel
VAIAAGLWIIRRHCQVSTSAGHAKNAWREAPVLRQITGKSNIAKVMLKEFKEFAFKGNLIDMAVGIIIGGAFGTVVKSLVDNVFMPVLGKLTGGVNFTEQYLNLNFPDGPKLAYSEALKKGEPVIGYGQFLTDMISFLLLAFAVFLVVKKALGVLHKEQAKPAPAPPPPTTEEKLLTEIRDLLKQKA